MRSHLVVFCTFSLGLHSAWSQNFIIVSGNTGGGFVQSGVYGDLSVPNATFQITGHQNGTGVDAHVKFKLDSIVPAVGVLVVSPSSGVTPQRVVIGLNPNEVVKAEPFGSHKITVIFTTVDQSPAFKDVASVTVSLPYPRPPIVSGVSNSASLQPIVAPGANVSIFGTSLGPPRTSDFGSDGLYPISFGNTTVTFDGIAAPLLSTGPGQINAVAPYAIAGRKSTQVVVSHYGQTSDAFPVPVADISPAIFTSSQKGTGQGAILNSDSSYNSADNPAPRGSMISIYATGTGVWDDTVQDGSISLLARLFTTQPISVTIGGKPTKLQYAGAAPYQTMGMLQVNAFVPSDVGSGAQPIVLTVGTTDNAQQGVTVAVQ